MGKITVKDAEALQAEGILSETVVADMREKGLVSKERTSFTFTFKTPENRVVVPCLYFKGAKGTTKSKKMVSFITDYNELLKKYAPNTNNKTK